MESTDQYDDFLAAVETLRDSDAAIRTTVHTSSVSADGWIGNEPDTGAEDR